MGRENGPSEEDMGLQPSGTRIPEAQGEKGRFSWDKEKVQDQANQAIAKALEIAESVYSYGSGPDAYTGEETIGEVIVRVQNKITEIRNDLKMGEQATAQGKELFLLRGTWVGSEETSMRLTGRLEELENALSRLQHLSDKSRTIGEMRKELEGGVK